jgi:hypothetical protein
MFADFRSDKNAFRRELHLLSKLQSVYAWRGSLVDYVITVRIIPALRRGWALDKDSIVGFARQLFDQQLAFARANRLREPGMTATKAGESFAALAVIEYGGDLSDEILELAWRDVETALTNLLEMTDLLDSLKTASQLIPQRALTFEHFDMTFRAVPDLIAFFENRPPLIVDWKVHSRAMKDYRLQLAVYALALKRCPPHRDFPASLKIYEATDFQLLEVQLLTAFEREHRFSTENLNLTEDFITSTMMEVKLAIDGKASRELDPYDFPITSNPDNCARCNFRKPCMEEIKCQQPAQMNLLF